MGRLHLGRSLLVFLILIFMLAYFYPENIFGVANYGSFKDVWAVDCTSEIGFVEPSASMLVSYNVDKGCGIPGGTLGKLRKMIIHSASVWGEPLGLKLQVTDDMVKNYTATVRVVSRETFRRMNLSDPANSFSGFDRDSVVGLVNRDEFKYVGSAKALTGAEKTKNQSIDVKVYGINKQTIYIVWDDEKDSEYQTKGYDLATWQTLISHEFGHAIGYRGHSTDKAQKPLMYSGGSDVLSWKLDGPTGEDISHMMNVYKFVDYQKTK